MCIVRQEKQKKPKNTKNTQPQKQYNLTRLLQNHDQLFQPQCK